jgi:hypothetical protein
VDRGDPRAHRLPRRADRPTLGRHREQIRPFAPAVELLCTVVGIQHRGAQCILGEIGADTSRFPSARHLASWAGQCPGNDQSAGKRRSGKTRNGSKSLDFALEEAAMAAIRVKANYPAAQYQRLKPRRGHKRALGAVKHSLICAIWHILSTGETYRREVGMDAWCWEELQPWLELRVEIPVGPLFCVINGPTRGRQWSGAAARADLRRTAVAAGVRRRFAPHQLRHAHAVELAREACR